MPKKVILKRKSPPERELNFDGDRECDIARKRTFTSTVKCAYAEFGCNVVSKSMQHEAQCPYRFGFLRPDLEPPNNFPTGFMENSSSETATKRPRKSKTSDDDDNVDHSSEQDEFHPDFPSDMYVNEHGIGGHDIRTSELFFQRYLDTYEPQQFHEYSHLLFPSINSNAHSIKYNNNSNIETHTTGNVTDAFSSDDAPADFGDTIQQPDFTNDNDDPTAMGCNTR